MDNSLPLGFKSGDFVRVVIAEEKKSLEEKH